MLNWEVVGLKTVTLKKLTKIDHFRSALIILVLLAVYNFTLSPLVEKGIYHLFTNVVQNQRHEESTLFAAVQVNDNTSYSSTLSQLPDLRSTPVLGATNTGSKGSQVVTVDSRVVAMRNFLKDYNSPMYPYAADFIDAADRTGLDWRLVASISGVESAFGTIIPYHEQIGYSNNGWGWKGYTHPQLDSWSYFTSWKQGIDTVTEGLARGYGTTSTPFDIVTRYCPPCARTEGQPWARGVTRFMNQLSAYEEAARG